MSPRRRTTIGFSGAEYRREWHGSACLLACVVVLAGCVPKAPALTGVPAPARIPSAQLPAGHQRVLFRWSYVEGELDAQGDGVARIAAPDSVRLDLFLTGAIGGSGTAFLIGDTIFAPGGDPVRRYLPSPPLLWAALGRSAVPPAPDTVARVDGDTLRADIGRGGRVWRLTFVGERLVALDRLDGGRRLERVVRSAGGNVRYVHEQSNRSLRLEITRTVEAGPFDAAIWNR